MTEYDAIRFVGPDEECMWCRQTSRSGAWMRPCPGAPADRPVHDTLTSLLAGDREKLAVVARSASRAAYELERTANRIESLPSRLARKVLRLQPGLDPVLLRNEAERARDTLHVYELLDL